MVGEGDDRKPLLVEKGFDQMDYRGQFLAIHHHVDLISSHRFAPLFEYDVVSNSWSSPWKTDFHAL